MLKYYYKILFIKHSICFHLIIFSLKNVFLSCFSCVVEDGSGEATIYLDDEKLIRTLLLINESKWRELIQLAKENDGICYQRSAYWKVLSLLRFIMIKNQSIY